MCLTISELAVLENEIAKLICGADEEFGMGFIAESPEKLRRIARHFCVQLGLEQPESPVCNAPWVSAVIEADGSVRPCFFHPSMGNLQGTSLEAIVNGANGRSFRQNLDIPNNMICKNCVCSLNYRARAEGVGHGESSPE
jgi:MoaA/NifB/PqqE/SkfB family radical SAM enzyme